MRLPAALAIMALAFQVQAIPPRDPGRPAPPDPTGTATIRGHVVGSDTGAPVTRASVTLVATAPPLVLTSNPESTNSPGSGNGEPPPARPPVMRPKTVTTDNQGNFEFAGIPAGRYRVRASPGQFGAQYLAIAYGAKTPAGMAGSDPGQPIDIAENQTASITIPLPRGSVITGRVTDDNGAPLARVQVYTLRFTRGNPRGMRAGIPSSTDDRGQFRIFALEPGDYVIVAEGRQNTFVAPNAPAPTEQDRNGFLTTYYPGTPSEAEAQRVHVGVAVEMSAVDIRMSMGRLFHVSGTVVDSQGQPAHATGFLAQGSDGMVQNFGFSTDPQGRFQMQNIPPGDYRLVVRGMQNRMQDDKASAPAPEAAILPLSVTDDVENIPVRLSPGVTITGQIVYEGTPPAGANGQSPPLRVTASPGDPPGGPGTIGVPPALVASDLTFTMKGLLGEYLLRAASGGARLKSVLLGGSDDITDTPHEFKNGDHVTIVLTTQTSTVQGTVSDAAGAPSSSAFILMFSDNKALWRSNSTRTHISGTDQIGQFRIPGVLPGNYLIIAVPRDRIAAPLNDPSLFENLAKDATPTVIGDNEQRTLTLKIVTPDGGGF